jgi:hypothetical protein
MLHRLDHTPADWRSDSKNTIGVLAKLRKLVFVGYLSDDEFAACFLDGPPLLLDIRKTVIGDNDLHVASLVGLIKSHAFKL